MAPQRGSLLWIANNSATPRVFASGGGGSFTSPANNRGTLVQNVDNSYTYDGFGKATVVSETSGWGDRYKYTGRELDGETGLQYNRSR